MHIHIWKIPKCSCKWTHTTNACNDVLTYYTTHLMINTQLAGR